MHIAYLCYRLWRLEFSWILTRRQRSLTALLHGYNHAISVTYNTPPWNIFVTGQPSDKHLLTLKVWFLQTSLVPNMCTLIYQRWYNTPTMIMNIDNTHWQSFVIISGLQKKCRNAWYIAIDCILCTQQNIKLNLHEITTLHVSN